VLRALARHLAGTGSRADLMVLHLHLDPAPDQAAHHLRPQVGVMGRRRHREVTALVPGLVGKVAAVLLPSRVPGSLDGVEVIVGRVRPGLEACRVEDVELRLRPEIDSVRDARAAQEVLGLTRDVARVAAVRLASQRVVHEERVGASGAGGASPARRGSVTSPGTAGSSDRPSWPGSSAGRRRDSCGRLCDAARAGPRTGSWRPRRATGCPRRGA
jgi:hypothetical protein